MFSESFKSFFTFTVIKLIAQFNLIQFYCLIYMAFQISVRAAIIETSNIQKRLSPRTRLSLRILLSASRRGRVTVQWQFVSHFSRFERFRTINRCPLILSIQYPHIYELTTSFITEEDALFRQGVLFIRYLFEHSLVYLPFFMNMTSYQSI